MKYFISEPWFILREFFVSNQGIKEELKEIHKNGYVVVENFIKEEMCSFLIEKFNEHKENPKAWKDAVGSDTRLHGIEKKVKEFAEIFETEKLNKIYKNYVHSSMESIILCNHIKPIENNIGSGGGWHRDSIHRRQLKFILYLTDAEVQNGCFQYIAKSHKVQNKYQINRTLKKRSGEYRYSEADIISITGNSEEFKITNISGKAGDLIIVDTSGIHRGAPIKKGERYAITKYMWEHNIPQSLKDLIIE